MQANGSPRRQLAGQRATLLLLAASALLQAPLPAAGQTAEREIDLRFLPPAGAVDGYRFRLTNEDSGVATPLDVGLVAPDASGVCHSPVLLDAAPYRVSMTAYNTAGESAPSNEIQIPGLCDVAACDDGNPCTADACDASGGCLADPLHDGSVCDDGSAATQGDQCVAGGCQGSTASALLVSALVPSAVRPGTSDIQILGAAFASGATLRF
jgi:hypothetical protein